MNVIFFLIGCVLSSYLQVVIQHGLLYSILKKRSTCDRCYRVLKWYETIPIVSYIFLKGKSGCCSKSIAISYLIFEILGGYCSVLIGMLYVKQQYLQIIWLVFLFIGTIYDVAFRVVPNRLIGLLCLCIVSITVFHLSSFIILVIVGIVILQSKLMGYIGGADIKIILLLLYSFDLIDVLYLLLYASVIAMLFVLCFCKSKRAIPFVPFLLIGYLIIVIH